MPVKIFFCYAREDEQHLNTLKKYLTPMHRQGLIAVWHDRDISAGTEWEKEIKEHLNEADIILLLVSPDFMNSDYCYSIEMKRALERHKRKEARVIPIILRPIDWQDILGNIQALPTDARAILSSKWHSPDEAFYDTAQGIRKVVEQLYRPPMPVNVPSTPPAQLAPLVTKQSALADKTLRCSNCNTQFVAGDVFCSGCGNPLALQQKTCPTCKFEYKPGEAFCPNCGTPLYSL